MKKCKHKWVDMEDGSLDKFCVRSRKFAQQAMVTLNSVQALDVGSQIAEGFAKGFEKGINTPPLTMGNSMKESAFDNLIDKINKKHALSLGRQNGF